MSGLDLPPQVRSFIDDAVPAQKIASGLDPSVQNSVDAVVMQWQGSAEPLSAEWFWEGGKRAARGVADVAVGTADAIPRGLSAVAEMAKWAARPLYGEDYDAQALAEGLRSAKGPVQIWTGKAAPDVLDVLQKFGALDDPQAVRQSQSAKLENSEMLFSMAGELAGFVLPGPSKFLGEKVGHAAEGIAGMASPMRRAAEKMVAAGKMTAEQATKATREGRLLTEMAAAAGWGKPGKLAAYVGDATTRLPPYAAMMAQMTAAAPADQQAEVALHTALMGPVYLGIGRVFQDLGEAVAKGLVNEKAAEAAIRLQADFTKGVQDPVRFKKDLGTIWNERGVPAVGNSIAAIGEAMGFTAASTDWQTLADAYSGDLNAQERLLYTFLGTTGGMLAAKGLLPADQTPFYKRIRPDLNDLRVEVEGKIAQERAAEAKRQKGEQDQAAMQHREATEAERMQAATAYEPLARFVNPLLRSGLEVSKLDLRDVNAGVELRDPGDGSSVRVRLDVDGNAAKVSVAPRLWRILRGNQEAPRDTEGGITLAGEAADFFLSELSTRAVSQRLKSAVEVEALGMEDTGRGYWRDSAGSRDVTVGIDGVYRERPFGSEDWRPVDLTDAILLSTGRQGEAAYWSPALDQWSEFLQHKRTFMEEPGADQVLGMALAYASRGTGPKAVEMRAFFEALKPEDVMSLFRPENSLVMAHSIASIGAGYGNASWAIDTIARANQIATTVIRGEGGKQLGVAFRAEDPANAQRQDLFDLAKSRFRNREAWEQRLRPEDPPAEAPKLLTFSELADTPMPQGVRAVEPVRIAEPGKEAPKEPAAAEIRSEAQATAQEPAGREGERGAVSLPGLGKQLVEGPRRYAELMVDRVSRMGDAGRDIAQRIKEGAGEIRERLGEIDPERARVAREFSSASPRKRGRELGRYLEESVEVQPGVFESREMILSRGGELPEPVPEALRAGVADWQRTYDAMRRRTGEDAMRSGTVRVRKGVPELARPAESPIRVRSDIHEDLRTAKPTDPRAREAVTKLAEINGIEKPDQLVEAILGKPEMGKVRVTPTEREAAMEQARTLPFMPQKVRLSDGSYFHFLEGSPQSAFESLVAQFQRNVAVSKLGQEGIRPETKQQIAQDPNTPPEIAQKLAEDRPGAQALLDRLVKQGADTSDFEVAQRLVQSFAGIGSEGFRGTMGRLIENPIVEGLVNVQLSAAGIYDATAAAFFAPALTGGFGRALLQGRAPNVVKALFKMFGEDGWTIANKNGAVLREMLVETFRRRTGKIGVLLRAIGAPSRYLQKFNELWTATSANLAVKDMRAGRDQAYYAEVLRGMGFEPGEIAAMTSGSAGTALYNRYVQQVTALLTGSTLPHEGTYAGASRKFTSLVRFQRWAMARSALLYRDLGQIATAKDGATAFRATRHLLGQVLGVTLGGMASLFLMRLAKEGPEDAIDAMSRKGIGETAGEGFAATQLSGAPYQWIADAWKVAWGIGDPARAGANATYPTRVGYEMAQMIGELGPYRNMHPVERVMTWAGRTVAIGKYMDGVLAAAGIINDWGVDEATSDFYRWMEREKGPQDRALFSDFERPKFRRAMRTLYKEATAAAGDADLASVTKAAMQEVLGLGSGKEIARSLRAAKRLTRLSPEELAAAREAIGETKLGRLYMADRALEQLASLVESQSGTQAEVEKPALQQRLAEAEAQTRLGNEGDVWSDLWSDVKQRAVASVTSGHASMDEVRMLADKLALYPEVFGKVLGDSRMARAVAQAGTGERWQMVYGLLAKRVMESARQEARERARR